MSTAGPRKLRAEIICPHCWFRFPPQEIRWVSVHPDLRGDLRLGEDAQQRFLPSRFDAECRALDPYGTPCTELACPNCHLIIPRSLLDLRPFFVSILGAPGSGKSYYLAASIWKLRQTLLECFCLEFGDADPAANQLLIDYEERLFVNSEPDEPVALPKTEKDGDLYESVNFDGRVVWFPRPFVFSMQPSRTHPNASQLERLGRALCLYDNAGEHFLPGGETPNSPGTRHLVESEALLFLFDPTQHPRFREVCREKSDDPQLGRHGWAHRQDHVLLEAAKRIRAGSQLSQQERIDKLLIVVVTKFDAWSCLTRINTLDIRQVVRRTRRGIDALLVRQIEEFSQQLRKLLVRYAPEVVSAAEGTSKRVVYVPVSSLGTAPELMRKKNRQLLAVRPRNIRPMWTEVPFLYAFFRCIPGMIPTVRARKEDAQSQLRLYKETGS